MKHTEESKAKLRLSKLGPLNPMYGKCPSPQQRAAQHKRMLENHPFKGKYHKDESKVKMRIAKLGVPISSEHRAAISLGLLGHKTAEETKIKIRASMMGKNVGKYSGGNTGMKMSPEFCEKRRIIMKKMWADHRQKLLNVNPHFMGRQIERIGPIHNRSFTALDRRLWLKDSCFYCGSTQDLSLDHIIPRFAGGMNTQPNAQTLCRSCNRWKHTYVDTPLWFAMQNKLRTTIPKPRPFTPL